MKSAVLYAIVVTVVLGYVKGESNDTLACCPPDYFITFENKNDSCWRLETNTTAPFRLAKYCKQTIKKIHFYVEDGHVNTLQLDNSTNTFDHTEACIGTAINLKKGLRVQIAALCISEPKQVKEDLTFAYCMIVSVVFLVLTALVYCSFSELRDLFGKSVINFCVSLMFGMGLFATIRFTGAYQNEYKALCATGGFLAYFFVIASFFWSNSLSIQILRDTWRSSTSDYGWRSLRWYMLYSWLCPAVLTTVMAVVNYYPGDHETPGIGKFHCWFQSVRLQWYYMYSVITILILINTAIFIYISSTVWGRSFSSSHINAVKFKLWLTLRLLVILGVPWIFEMIGTAVETNIIWTIISVFNSLQGLAVFLLLVVFRKRVIKVIYKRGWLDCCSGLVDKYLAVTDDAEANVIQHTDVPLSDDQHIKK